ncbi:hypothetical protein HGT73_05320 [Rosenbergiella australiborealis]|uniref:Uncharacterized protein n=1 Tax=Rosenbergiella australiborealis TaxID=1544696 RepID=A0ABS5T3S7_9GAMM|nr:hypothetical protein [Rosenbergiella australiborealis]MBT0726807.1 hypothetical protein [Rosenbergiella australiborealis]
MARAQKPIEVPGQEPAAVEPEQIPDTSDTETNQSVEATPDVTPDIAARNQLLSTLHPQATDIIARFEALGFIDDHGSALTDNLDFINLVKQATVVTIASGSDRVTNDEGKRQPVTGAPVLTERGWHIPG